MTGKNKKMIGYAAVVGGLMLLAYFCRIFQPEEGSFHTLLRTVLVAVRNVIHICLLLVWCISVRRRILHKQVRRLLLCVGGLLIFWLVDKIVKWEFTGSETHWLVRYLWYGFYIPMLFVPTLGVFIINYIGKPEGYTHPKVMNYLLLPPTLLLAAVFTNDLHQKVFVFYNGIHRFNLEYSYDWVYGINMGWFVVLGFYFVMMLLIKSRVSGNRKMWKYPLMIMIFAALFWVGYSMRLYDCDLTVMDCTIIVLLLESAIQGGLLPSNGSYREVFDGTTLPLWIVDQDYQPHYVSAGALPISEEMMRRAEKGTVHMGNSLLSSAPIAAGHVVWQDDITQLKDLQDRLRDTLKQLDEENTLLQAELELKESRAKAEEQNRLYDRIAREVEPQLAKAERLLHRMEAEPENAHSLLARVCVLGSYIKRRGNLLLLGEEAPWVSAWELKYCIRESLENLRLGQVYTSLQGDCDGELPLKRVVAVYDFFETTVERLLDDLTAMMVNLTCKDGNICMNIQMGSTEEITHQMLDGLEPPYGSFTYDIMEEDLVLNLVISGEAAEQ